MLALLEMVLPVKVQVDHPPQDPVVVLWEESQEEVLDKEVPRSLVVYHPEPEQIHLADLVQIPRTEVAALAAADHISY